MRSIRAELAFGLVAGLALLLGAGGAALYFRTKASLERQDDAALLSKAWALAASVHVDEGDILFDPAPALAADFERADRLAGYEIRRRDGRLFASSRSIDARAAQREVAHAGSIGREPTFAWTELRAGQTAREVALRIPVLSEDTDADMTSTKTTSVHEPVATRESAVARESAVVQESAAAHDFALEHRSAAARDASTVHESGTAHESAVEREVNASHSSAPDASAQHGRPSASSPHRELLDEFSIRVAEEQPETQATLAGLRTTILIVITLAFLMSLVLVHFALQRGLSPLEAMAAQAQKIDAESLDQRFSKEPLPAELEPIRTRLNDLLDRLQQSFERERRFNAAVAHELRTPIAELRALSEIALRWPESSDPKKNMSDVSAVAQEMQSVIEALLTLRRVESGAEKVELAPVRVDELVRSTLAAYGKAATARDQALRVNVATNITIESHPHMLRSIISNLVSNAIEYAPRGSTIAIEARIESGHFTFSTKNPAPELTPDDVLHLFEPFWRKDAVRTTGSHAGLGLTLTESLAKALGCTVHAVLEPAGVLKIELAGALVSNPPTRPHSGSVLRSDSAKERVEIS